jgi:hypothetical protein
MCWSISGAIATGGCDDEGALLVLPASGQRAEADPLRLLHLFRLGVPKVPEPLAYEAADCFKVERIPGGFLVRHFPDRETRRSCCTLRIQITEADRAQAIPDADPHGEAAALHRSYLAIEKKHGRGGNAPQTGIVANNGEIG